MIRQQSAPDRAAIRAALYAALANLLVVVSGVIVLTLVQEVLFTGIPLTFKVWLIVPIIAFVLGLYLVYRTVLVWRQGLLAGIWARLRYSVVTLAAVFMCWFYWYWNILGFQYL